MCDKQDLGPFSKTFKNNRNIFSQQFWTHKRKRTFSSYLVGTLVDRWQATCKRKEQAFPKYVICVWSNMNSVWSLVVAFVSDQSGTSLLWICANCYYKKTTGCDIIYLDDYGGQHRYQCIYIIMLWQHIYILISALGQLCQQNMVAIYMHIYIWYICVCVYDPTMALHIQK